MQKFSNTRSFIIILTVGWLFLFGTVPLILLVVTSFLTVDQVSLVRLPFSVDAYTHLADSGYLKVIIRSFKLAAITTLLCLIVGYPFAWYTSRMSPRWRVSILILLMVPFWTNSLVRAYAMRMVLGTKGVVNKVLLYFDIIESPLRIMYTDYAVFAGLFYLMLPFMILPLYASVEKFNYQFVEAARDLGAGTIKTFTQVIFPLTSPGIVAGCVMVFVPTMGLFYVSSLLGGSRQLLIGNLIQQQFLNARNWPLGSATSVLLIVVVIAMLACYGLLLRRLTNRQMESSS